ncbi:MAG: alpha/beta fold hydrolase [Beijerinckiaceae bacterium]
MPVAANGLHYDAGGRRDSDGPLAVLLHGLSGTGAVWRGLTDILDARWPGSWIAPDFRGHGRSPHAERYGIALHAADIAGLIDASRDIYLVGHSMGGQCAMVLASGCFGFTPKTAITLGVAVDWGNEARERIDRLAHTPVRWFESENLARERFVRVNGLEGSIDPQSEIAATGIRQEAGRWRLAADNRAATVASASTRRIYAAATAPIVLARGQHDPMVTRDEHLSLDPFAIEISGCAHNVHVENPEAVWGVLQKAKVS